MLISKQASKQTNKQTNNSNAGNDANSWLANHQYHSQPSISQPTISITANHQYHSQPSVSQPTISITAVEKISVLDGSKMWLYVCGYLCLEKDEAVAVKKKHTPNVNISDKDNFNHIGIVCKVAKRGQSI